jgi:hypothetical protein
LLLAARLPAATNDLVITSITRQNDCTTLTWRSHPGEYYTVYRAVSLQSPVFWQVAEVNVPSGGTNTTWSEGDCSESMMAGAPPPPAMSAEERAAFLEKFKDHETPAWLYPPGHPKNPDKSNPIKSPYRLELEKSGGLEAALALSGGSSARGRFYRVARTGVAGFIDGWGFSLGDTPENLAAYGDAFVVSASPRDLGAHSLAILTNGLVVAWGHSSQGQCNVPTNLVDVVAVAAGGRHSMALTRAGELVMWGDDSLGQITNKPAGATNLAAIAAGIWHSMALRADGTVFAWGDLFNGTNSVPAGLSNVTAIAAGPRTCLALRSDGTVAAWGFDYAMLGNALATNVPASLSNVVAISAGMGYNQALLKDGTMRLWGVTNLNAQATTPYLGLTNLLATSAGWHYGLALSNNATVARWGQIGGGEGMDGVVALSAGAGHVLVLRTNSSSPVIRKQPRDLIVPAGTSSNIAVVASSSMPLRYQWRKDGADLVGKTNASLAFPDLQDADDGLYQVRVSTDAGEVWSRVARVSAVRPPVITNQTPELNICRPQFAPEGFLRVGVYSKGTDRVTYQWFHDGLFMPTTLSPSLFLSYRSTNFEGQYFVIAQNAAGRATSAVWTVKIRLQGEATG